MITTCASCDRKTRQIDASLYAGDYHGGDLYAFGRQCVECGTIYEAQKIGKTVSTQPHTVTNIPPRNRWEEPML